MSNIFFCDVDGCLVRGNTSFDFADFLVDKKKVEEFVEVQKIREEYRGRHINQDEAVTKDAISYSRSLRNRSLSEITVHVNEFFEQKRVFNAMDKENSYLFEKVIEAFNLLTSKNYEILLISGGVDLVVKPFMEALQSKLMAKTRLRYIASEVPVSNGVFTGEEPLSSKMMTEEIKKSKIESLLKNPDGSRCYGRTLSAGDSEGDYGMFGLADTCFVYNPRIYPAPEKGKLPVEGILDKMVKDKKVLWKIYLPTTERLKELNTRYPQLDFRQGSFLDAVISSLAK